MKKLILGLIAAISLIGCKTVWTTDEAYKVGTGVGFTTAYVLNNQAKVDDTTRNTIVNIINEVQKYVPGTNETFTTAWTPIVNNYVDNLVKEEKLTKKQAERIKSDFSYVTSLLDAYVEKKGIKKYQDCIDAFVDGFCTKFLEYFKPVNTFGTTINEDEIDEFAEGYLLRAINN